MGLLSGRQAARGKKKMKNDDPYIPGLGVCPCFPEQTPRCGQGGPLLPSRGSRATAKDRQRSTTKAKESAEGGSGPAPPAVTPGK